MFAQKGPTESYFKSLSNGTARVYSYSRFAIVSRTGQSTAYLVASDRPLAYHPFLELVKLQKEMRVDTSKYVHPTYREQLGLQVDDKLEAALDGSELAQMELNALVQLFKNRFKSTNVFITVICPEHVTKIGGHSWFLALVALLSLASAAPIYSGSLGHGSGDFAKKLMHAVAVDKMLFVIGVPTDVLHAADKRTKQMKAGDTAGLEELTAFSGPFRVIGLETYGDVTLASAVASTFGTAVSLTNFQMNNVSSAPPPLTPSEGPNVVPVEIQGIRTSVDATALHTWFNEPGVREKFAAHIATDRGNLIARKEWAAIEKLYQTNVTKFANLFAPVLSRLQATGHGIGRVTGAAEAPARAAPGVKRRSDEQSPGPDSSMEVDHAAPSSAKRNIDNTDFGSINF